MHGGDDRDARTSAGWGPVALLVVLVVALVYAPSVRNGFAFDDAYTVEEASYLLSRPALLPRLFSNEYFALSGEATWRPVVTASYMLDWQIGGGAPFAFHLQSLLWHLLACVLAFRLFAELLRDRWGGASAALLFGVHPLATEAVDAIAFREDVTCTALGLAAVVLTLRPGRVGRTSLAGLLLLLALLAKETAIVFVVLAPLAWWGADAAGGRPAGALAAVRSRRGAVLSLAVAVVVFLVLRFGVFGAIEGYAEHPGGSLATGVASGLVALLHYVRLLFVPTPLCADYRGVVPPVTDLADVRAWGGAVLLAALAVAAWRLHRRAPVVTIGVAWFVVALTPTLGLVAIPVFMAERFVYLALPGAVLALVAGGLTVARRTGRRSRAGLAVVVVGCAVVFGSMTWGRHRVWRDDLSLWGATVADFPESYGALHGLGTAVQATGGFEESLPYLLDALRIAERTPGVADHERAGLLAAIGTAHGAAGRAAESIEALERSLALQEGGQARYHLALGYLQVERIADAERELRAAIEAEPTYAPPYAPLADLLRARGETDEADRLRARHGELSGPR